MEWLGRVPAHWDVTRLGRVSSIESGYAFPAEQFGFDGVPVVRMSDLKDGHVSFESIKRVDTDVVPTKSLAQVGDILIGLSGSISNFAQVKSDDLPLAINQRVGIVRAHRDEAQFITYFLRSSAFSEQIQSQLPETTILNISMEQIRSCALAWPDSEEINAIRQGLDRETARIDALMERKTRFIELLREKRQALITCAITKGLDPHVKMKDSGVKWLGDVPEHWEVRSVSSMSTKITNGFVGPTRDILVEGGVRYLQSLHIKGNQIKFDVPYFVTEAWSNQHKKSILETGDVLIVQTGDIGQVTVVTDEFAGCNCHALIIVSPIRSILAGEWISWVFNSSYGYHSLLAIQTGAMHPHLNCGNVKDVFLPVPSLEEQREIIQYVETEERRVAALITKTVSSIELLKERRSALITAAVTGQIDLRGAV